MSQMGINYFDLDRKFSLNQNTVNYIMKNDEKPTNSESLGMAIQNNISTSECHFDETQPYLSAINFFKNMKDVYSPIHKLKVIVQTSEKIDECIHEFYKVLHI